MYTTTNPIDTYKYDRANDSSDTYTDVRLRAGPFGRQQQHPYTVVSITRFNVCSLAISTAGRTHV